MLILFRGLLDRRLVRRLWLLVAGAAAALVPVSLLGLIYQGAVAGGYGLVDAAHPSLVNDVLSTRFGQWWSARD